MYSIKINKKTFNMPETWNELEHYKWKKLVDAKENEKELKTYDIFSILSGIPVSIIKKIPIQQLHELNKLANFFYKEEVPVVNTEDILTEFEYDGETYYLRNFRAETTFEEWIDFKETDDIIIQLAVMAKKKVKTTKWNWKKFKKTEVEEYETYDDYDINERIKHFSNLDIITIKKLSNFFFNNYKTLQIFISQYSLVLESLTLQVESIKSSMKSGAGMGLYNKYQIWILTKMKKRLEKDWLKFSNSTLIQQENLQLMKKQIRLDKNMKNIKSKIIVILLSILCAGCVGSYYINRTKITNVDVDILYIKNNDTIHIDTLKLNIKQVY